MGTVCGKRSIETWSMSHEKCCGSAHVLLASKVAVDGLCVISPWAGSAPIWSPCLHHPNILCWRPPESINVD